MNTTKPVRRLDYLDVAKGIGILLVITGHAFRDEMRYESDLAEFTFQAIYFFHMALFFVISGITFGISFRKYSDKPALFLKTRIQSLLIPWFTYAAAIYLCFFTAFQIPALQQALSGAGFSLFSYPEYLSLSILEDNPYSVHLWYLFDLFLYLVIAFFCFRRTQNTRRTELCFALVTLIIYLGQTFFSLSLMFGRICILGIYFAVGIILSSRQELLFKKSRLGNIAMALGWLFMLSHTWLSVKGYEFRVLNQPLIFALCQLIANLLIICSILKLSRRLEQCKLLLRFGRESYNLYLLHQPFCCGFVGAVLYNQLGLNAVFVYVLCFLLSILIPAAAVMLCRKVKPLGKIAKVLFNFG